MHILSFPRIVHNDITCPILTIDVYVPQWLLKVLRNQFGLMVNYRTIQARTFARIMPVGASFGPSRARINPLFDNDGTW
jgi:hypothetical protein